MNMNSTLILLCHRYSPIQTPPDEGIDGYTFRGLGHCENQRGSTLSYNTIFGVETIQECGSACEDRYSSNSNFRGINFLPSMLQMQSRRGEPPTWSEPNCNCMMEEGSGGDILSANGINEELCYSWDGPSEVSEHPAFGFRGFEFQGMGCCMNDRVTSLVMKQSPPMISLSVLKHAKKRSNTMSDLLELTFFLKMIGLIATVC